MLPLNQAIDIFDEGPQDPTNPTMITNVYRLERTATDFINVHHSLIARMHTIFSDRSFAIRLALLTTIIGSATILAFDIEALSKDDQNKVEMNRVESLLSKALLCGVSIGAFCMFDLKELGECIKVKMGCLPERVQRIFF